MRQKPSSEHNITAMCDPGLQHEADTCTVGSYQKEVIGRAVLWVTLWYYQLQINTNSTNSTNSMQTPDRALKGHTEESEAENLHWKRHDLSHGHRLRTGPDTNKLAAGN